MKTRRVIRRCPRCGSVDRIVYRRPLDGDVLVRQCKSCAQLAAAADRRAAEAAAGVVHEPMVVVSVGEHTLYYPACRCYWVSTVPQKVRAVALQRAEGHVQRRQQC